MLELLIGDPRLDLAFSGAIDTADDPNQTEIGESERLHLDPFDIRRLSAYEDYIAPHAWIARRGLLDPAVLRDPDLGEAEDLFLLLSFLSKTDFAFSWRPTAEWRRRSARLTPQQIRRFGIRFQHARWRRTPTLISGEITVVRQLAKIQGLFQAVRRAMARPFRLPQSLWRGYRRLRTQGTRTLLTKST